jgi:glycosyltransferase involved in cell wall biosynthesis
MRKKKILIHSNFCKAFTGFGKNKKNILKYLANTDKYEIFEAANGKIKGDPNLNSLPWKCYGTVPANYNSLQGDEKRKAGYGQFEIENIIKEVKPDVYIGIEDIWGFSDLPNQPWWDKINKMIWTTLDSLPILQQAIDFAPKLEHYYVWASFAEKAMNDIGYDNVKTLRGSIDTSHFYRKSKDERDSLREANGINKNDFIIGFVFRNQLRKSVPNLLDGFKLFKKEAPNAKLLLHTHWSEGWDIPTLLKEKGIDNSDILTTYFCKKCQSYLVQNFTGQEKNCGRCGGKKTVNTANISHGVSELQLNDIYNLMDVYCHPFTSGGQEIPIQEAKLTELITLVTNYSCGEDNCTPESGGLELEWNEYREPGTQFIKASTCPKSIYDKLKQVYEMSEDDRLSIGSQARQWVIDNFSVEVIGKRLEEIIDDMPFIEDFDFTIKDLNEEHEFKNDLPNEEFILDLYENILFDSVDKNSSGFKIWLSKLENREADKKTIYDHFINTAKKTNLKRKSRKDFGSLFSEEDEGRRVAIVIPRSSTDVLLINSLIKKLKHKHKKHNIYVFTESSNFQYIEDNPDVYQCLQYAENIDSPRLLEGASENKGFFEFAYFPHTTTQKFPCYIHNGK